MLRCLTKRFLQVKFAKRVLKNMCTMTRQMEVTLGPDTTTLGFRIGLNRFVIHTLFVHEPYEPLSHLHHIFSQWPSHRWGASRRKEPLPALRGYRKHGISYGIDWQAQLHSSVQLYSQFANCVWEGALDYQTRRVGSSQRERCSTNILDQ